MKELSWQDVEKLYQTGEFDKALSACLLFIEKNPDAPQAWNNLGSLYFKRKDWQQAITAYCQALQLKADYLDVYYNLGLAYQKSGQIDFAILTYESLLELSPNHPGARFQLATIYIEQQKLPQAISILLILAEDFPYHFETHANLGSCYIALSNWQNAAVYLHKAYDIDQKDTQVMYNLAIVYTELGRIQEAIQFYLQLVSFEPDFFEAHYNLSVLYLKIKDRKKALEHIRKALSLRPQHEPTQHMFEFLSQHSSVTAVPNGYIRSLFDNYANHYEDHVLHDLDYVVPQKFKLLFDEYVALNDLAILDLGCGTGLCGEIFKTNAKKIIGIDLSKDMLKLAANKYCYDQLIETNIIDYLLETTDQYDLIIAGDALVYFGDLQELMSLVRKRLNQNGYFLFNTEINQDSAYLLTGSGRFSHHKDYIEQIALENHFKMIVYEQAHLRKNDQALVMGHYYLLQNSI